MAKHDSGKIIWKLSDETKEGIRMRLIAGVVGFSIVIVLIIIMETTGLGR